MYSYGPLRIAAREQGGQLEPTYSSSVRIRGVALGTYRKWWRIGRGGERESEISVLIALQDDDDDDICIYIAVHTYIHTYIHAYIQCLSKIIQTLSAINDDMFYIYIEVKEAPWKRRYYSRKRHLVLKIYEHNTSFRLQKNQNKTHQK